MRSLPLATLLALASGCIRPPGIDPDTAPLDSDPPERWDPSAGEQVYDAEGMHRVQVEMDPGDWDELRQQKRNFLEILTGDCLEEPFDSSYSYFHADVTVDGERYEDVAIRKKGLLGSETSVDPSLKIRFDKYVDGQLHDGLDRITLNNGRQDPAEISQCLGYERFREAGLPASRCSFAVVELNGEPLGIYSNVEPVEPWMLARWFDDPEGRLWEGKLSDFREGWMGTFDAKEGDDDRTVLQEVAQALEQPDDQLLEALEPHVDLDAYLRFWAMEVLLGHWDGYAGNTNNFFVYEDPADGRLRFMPWGIDALFDSAMPFGEHRPASVVAAAALPSRLYGLEEGRERYYAALFELLDAHWDEDALSARIDGWEEQVLAEVTPDDAAGIIGGIDWIRSYVNTRRAGIEAELSSGPPAWEEELRGDPCLVDHGGLPVSFETTWGSYGTQHWDGYGAGTMALEFDGVDYPVETLGALAGEVHGEGALLVIGRLEWGSLIALLLNFPVDLLEDGTSYTMDWSAGDAYVYYDEGGTGSGFAVLGYLGDGPVTFDQASPVHGAAVVGSANLRIFGGQ
jgi:spore coat protein H